MPFKDREALAGHMARIRAIAAERRLHGPPIRISPRAYGECLDDMHIEPGEATAEDCNTEELLYLEELMSTAPVPLSHVGYAHNKALTSYSLKRR